MKKLKFMNVIITSIMLLNSIITPQMIPVLASMQAEEAEEEVQVDPAEDTDVDLAGDVDTDDTNGLDGESAEVDGAGGTDNTEDAEDELAPEEGDEVADRQPETITANSPPMVETFNIGTNAEISANLIKSFEMILNPGSNQQVIDKDTEINVDEVSSMQLNYTLSKPNDVTLKAGDTYTIDLPEIFDQTLRSPRPITIEETTIGNYIIENGKVVITFTAEVETFDDTEMHVTLQGNFDKNIFEREEEVVVNVPLLDGTTFEVVVRPEQKEYSGEDKKTAGFQYILDGEKKEKVDRNPEFIDWTIRVNDNMGTFENATIIDDLSDHLEIVKESIVVERIIRNYKNEEILPRETIEVTEDMINDSDTNNGFELNLGTINDAYEIKYTTSVSRPDGGGTHKINNNARIILDGDENPVSDSFEGIWSGDIPSLVKSGSLSTKNADRINWEIEYNYGKEELGSPVTLTDTLTQGEVDLDTVKIYQVDVDIDGNIIGENVLINNVEQSKTENGMTLSEIDANQKAYLITFSSSVPVGLNNVEVTNTIEDNLNNKDDASVTINTIPTGGKVSEQYVDEDGNPYIEWTITMNSKRVDISNINIIDVFSGEHLKFDATDSELYELYKDDNKIDLENYEIEDYTHEDGRIGFNLQVNDAGPHEYKFVYRTYYTELGMRETSIANQAELIFNSSEGEGIGVDVDASQTGPKAGIGKTGRYVLNEETGLQEIEWTIVFNESKILLNNPEIRDVFSSENYKYIEDTFKMSTDSGNFTNYDFNTDVEIDGEVYDFVVKINEETREKFTIKYRTTADDVNNLDQTNLAELTWQGGTEEADATVKKRDPGIDKTGKVVINGDGTKTVNWVVNFNINKNVIYSFKLVDNYTPTTVTVSDIKITSNGEDVTDDFTISSERTGGTFTVSKQKLDAVPYQLTYSTTLSAEEEIEELKNTANITYTGGSDSKSKTISRPTLGVQKEAVGGVDKTIDGDFINWKITANTDTANHLVNLVNPVLTDTIPSDQELVAGTIEVSRVSDDNFEIESEAIQSERNSFSIKLPNGAYQYEVTFKTKILEYPSVNEELDRYTNEVSLSNDGYEKDAWDDAYIDYFADGTNNNNTKNGVLNDDTENIDWTATVNPLGLTIKNARIVDKLSGNQVYLVEKPDYGIVVKNGEEILVEGEDYSLNMSEDKRNFTIQFNGVIDHPVTVSYSTRLNPELIGNITVSNKLELHGGEGDRVLTIVEKSEDTSQWTFGGGGSGRTLEFTLNKTNAKGNPVQNATFNFLRITPTGTEVPIGGERVITDAEGKFELTGVRAGRYIVTESEAPEGYIKIDQKIYMIIGYASPEEKELTNSDYIIKITDSNWNVITNSEVATGVGDQLTIINEHEPISVTLEATKTLEGNKTLEANQFTFELLQGNETIDLKMNDSDGNVQFKELTFNLPGTYNYQIKEIPKEPTDLKGVTYDESVYNVKIEVTSNDRGELSTNVLYSLDDQNIDAVKFINKYQAAPTEVTLEATKNLTGQELGDRVFKFEVVETNEDNENIVATGTSDSEGQVTFEAIEYTQIGTHEYTVREVNDGQGGITYDTTEYKVNVTITDDGVGQLHADVNYVDGELEFTNRYQAASTEVLLEASKNLTGQKLGDRIFNFEVVETIEDEETVVATGTSDSEGQVTFEAIEYTYTQTGTHEYTVREVNDGQGGITYDPTEYRVVVEVSDNQDGQLETEVKYFDLENAEVNEMIFNNRYQAASTEVILEANKNLSGQELGNRVFNFEVIETIEDEENVVTTGKSNSEGQVTFGAIEYTYTQTGIHEYTVREVNDGDNGITYDTTEYRVIVEVSDNQDGQLETEVKYFDLEDTEINEMIFNNNYSPASTTVTLEANKNLTGQELGDRVFKFEVVETIEDEESIVATGTSDSEGQVTFEDIEYAQIGTHEYTVREVNDGQGGINYDTTEYKVIVTIIDDGVGQLHADVNYVDGEIEFTNHYQAAVTEIILEAKKILNGQALQAGQFEFELLDSEGSVIEKVENTEDGDIVFEALNYNTTGEHTYTIREIKGNQGGVTYDETIHTVTVTITDDGVGQLHAAANYGKAENVVFTNSYEAAPDSIIFEAEKLLNGRDLTSGEFEFELVDSEGEVLQTAKNNADGQIYFSEITYEEAGEYTYTVRELEGNLEGVIYDNSVFTIVVTVTDDREGNLTATAEYIDGTVVFENTYTEPVDSNGIGGGDPNLSITDGVDDGDLSDEQDLLNAGEAAPYTWLAITLVVIGLSFRFYIKKSTNE